MCIRDSSLSVRRVREGRRRSPASGRRRGLRPRTKGAGLMFYHDVYRAQTSNATLNTEDKVAAMRTIANQRTCGIASLKLAGRYNGPGGVVLRLKTCATISTGGAAITPGKRDPGAPAAETTVFDSTYTAGGTGRLRWLVRRHARGACHTAGEWRRQRQRRTHADRRPRERPGRSDAAVCRTLNLSLIH